MPNDLLSRALAKVDIAVKDEIHRAAGVDLDHAAGFGETELSRSLADRICDRFRFVPEWAQWLEYRNGTWTADVSGNVRLEAKKLCDDIAVIVRNDETFGSKPEARERAALRFQAKKTVDAVLDLACVEPKVVVLANQLDANSDLLNTPAGTVDLTTGLLHPHDRENLLTKSTSIPFDNGRCPTFRKFLRDITRDDPDLADYLQRALGACLSGALTDHWLMFWYGLGRNGKNTLGDLVAWILGGYAKQVPTQTLMADAHGNRHPTEIANLRGLRLAVSSEVAEGEHWNESRVKELTGDAMLAGRYMRQDFFEFPRTHKHLIFGNHRPMLRIVDPAMAARLHIVPFDATFSVELGNLDPQMPEKLRAEAPAVLGWLIEGHLKWRTDGTLKRCVRVENCTREYLESQATLEHWLDERCAVVADDGRSGRAWLKSSELYQDYAAWKRDRGEHPLSQQRWSEQINRRFRIASSDGKRIVGLVFRSRFA